LDSVECFEEGWSLPPWHVVRLLEHVISVPSRDWDEWYLFWVVSDLLDKVGNFGLDFLETGLRVVGGFLVHLVDEDDELLDSKSVSEESVLSGLSVLVNSGFELSSW